jgi:molybdenum cofactor cytidylyltransferase
MAAGGEVRRVGMPVDPGNLLVLGKVGATTVIGAPGCARSPKLNGFDWVLDRLLAGLDVGSDDIAAMGVGGLLMEISSRPQPREAATRARSLEVHALLLAAGRSRRMGGPNKLLALFDGTPLARRTAEALGASGAAALHVVVGHQAGELRSALAGLDARIVENPEFETGLASSLKAGIAALPENAAGALVALADMPGVTAAVYDRLIEAFRRSDGEAIVRATHAGKRGNPVILPRALFAEVARLEGDTGARHLVEASELPVIDVEIGAAASLDVDTPEAMLQAGGKIPE